MTNTNSKIVTYGKRVGLAFLGGVLSNFLIKEESYRSAAGKLAVGAAVAILVPNADVKSFAVGIGIDGAQDAYVAKTGNGSANTEVSTGGVI